LARQIDVSPEIQMIAWSVANGRRVGLTLSLGEHRVEVRQKIEGLNQG